MTPVTLPRRAFSASWMIASRAAEESFALSIPKARLADRVTVGFTVFVGFAGFVALVGFGNVGVERGFVGFACGGPPSSLFAFMYAKAPPPIARSSTRRRTSSPRRPRRGSSAAAGAAATGFGRETGLGGASWMVSRLGSLSGRSETVIWATDISRASTWAPWRAERKIGGIHTWTVPISPSRSRTVTCVGTSAVSPGRVPGRRPTSRASSITAPRPMCRVWAWYAASGWSARPRFRNAEICSGPVQDRFTSATRNVAPAGRSDVAPSRSPARRASRNRLPADPDAASGVTGGVTVKNDASPAASAGRFPEADRSSGRLLGCGDADRRPQWCRDQRRERSAHLPRRRRTVGGVPARGGRHARGVRRAAGPRAAVLRRAAGGAADGGAQPGARRPRPAGARPRQ